MSADFTPEKEDYKILTPFKMQVLTNFPYIEADFDALTNYGLLCKVVEYLNNVIANENEVTEQVTSLYNAYVSLQAYVNQEIGDFETTVNNRVDGLESYMDNYFNNLDVQQEINNKLDAMALDGSLTALISGYVDPIYQAYENEINGQMTAFTNSINNSISEIDTKVDNATSGSPAGVYASVAALTAADPNHSKIYLVTDDGKWYYYNGAAWTAGGTYQSSGIADNSITILQLANDLNSNFEMEYSDILTPDTTNDGFINVSGNVQSDNSFSYDTYALTNGKIYNIQCYDNILLCGLVVKDSSNNIVYQTSSESYSGTRYNNIIFKCNDTNLTAYISYAKSKSLWQLAISNIREFENTRIVYKDNKPLLFKTINGYANSIIDGVGSRARFLDIADNGYTEIYQMRQGITYHISSFNVLSIAGLVITDNVGLNVYKSSTVSTNPAVFFDYEFTAETDGFILLSNYTKHTSTISQVDITNESNILYGKTIVCCGDSITAGDDMDSAGITDNPNIKMYQWNQSTLKWQNLTSQVKETYGYQIASRNNMIFYNGGVGGSTMQGLSNRAGFSLANGRYTKLPPKIDYLTIWFGWNDTAYGTLGTINDSTNESFYGGYNVVLPYLIDKYPYAKIALIVPFGTDADHRQAVRLLANKWGLACFDMYQGGTPLYYGKEESVGVEQSIVTSNRAKFQANGAHPNFKGHRQIGDMLEHFLRGI